MTAITIQKEVTRAEARRKGSYGIDAPYLLPIPVVLIFLTS